MTKATLHNAIKKGVKYKKRIELYKEGNVLQNVTIIDDLCTLELDFDESNYKGCGNTLELALIDAETKWQKNIAGRDKYDLTGFFGRGDDYSDENN